MKKLHFGTAYCVKEYYEGKLIHHVAIINLVSREYEVADWEIE
ncbi:MAG: hypothetical protein ACW980_24135 [Promethearchaeota archaeon]|jgi:hypothetical protein